MVKPVGCYPNFLKAAVKMEIPAELLDGLKLAHEFAVDDVFTVE